MQATGERRARQPGWLRPWTRRHAGVAFETPDSAVTYSSDGPAGGLTLPGDVTFDVLG